MINEYSIDKKTCKITKDLLLNCAKKSYNLDECLILKLLSNKYCSNYNKQIASSK